MNDSILAWHFLDDNKLRTGEQAPPDGEVLTFEGKIKICSSGLHASINIMHALTYAPGFTLCRVECSRIDAEHDDKFVCATRTILWRVGADRMQRVLSWFAYWCADRAAAAASASASAAYAAYAARASAAASAASADAAYAAYAASASASNPAYVRERSVQETELLRLIDLARGVS